MILNHVAWLTNTGPDKYVTYYLQSMRQYYSEYCLNDWTDNTVRINKQIRRYLNS